MLLAPKQYVRPRTIAISVLWVLLVTTPIAPTHRIGLQTTRPLGCQQGRYRRLRPKKTGWKLPVQLSSNHSATTATIRPFDKNSEGGSGKQRTAATPRPKERPKTLKARSIMSTTEAASKVFEEIAQLFGSGPTDEQILNFRPSADVAQRASKLLSLNRTGQMDDDLKHELDQYEQAELLMRMVKAQIRSRQGS